MDRSILIVLSIMIVAPALAETPGAQTELYDLSALLNSVSEDQVRIYEDVEKLNRHLSVQRLPLEIKALCNRVLQVDTFKYDWSNVSANSSSRRFIGSPIRNTDKLFENREYHLDFVKSLSLVPSRVPTEAQASGLDVSVMWALQQVYRKTGDIEVAKDTVSAVLLENGCDNSGVASIPVSTITSRIDSPFRGATGRPRSENEVDSVICEMKTQAWSSFAMNIGSLDPATQNRVLGQSMDVLLGEQCRPNNESATLRWSDVSWSGQCGTVMRSLREVCTGEETANSYFEARSRTDPQISMGPATYFQIFLAGLGVGLSYYGIDQASEEAVKQSAREILAAQENSLKLRNEEIGREQEALEQINAGHQALEASELGGLVDSKDAIDANKARINELEAEKEENNKRISEIQNKKIKVETDTEAAQGIVDDARPGNGVNLPMPVENLQQVMDAMWNERLQQLAKNAASCLGEDIMPIAASPTTSPQAELPTEEHTIKGSECNIGGAIADLNTTSQPILVPPDTEGQVVDEAPFDEKQRFGSVIGADFPICWPEPCSDEVMNQYYISKGYKGGRTEFCAIYPFLCPEILSSEFLPQSSERSP